MIITELAIAVACVFFAGLVTTAEAALQTFSKSRAERVAKEGRRGAVKLNQIMADPAPYLNTALFVRTVLEVAAIVLVAHVLFLTFDATWERILYTTLIMTVVSFVALGVAPRTMGRQHADAVAPAAAGPIAALNTILGPIPQIMIVIGNVLTPGRGFTDGPFTSEAELRELVDIAEASDLIEDGERKMIHSVFELGDTIVKEVMVPRTEMVWIEADKTLRQGLSLALRSGFSRIPVVGNDVDDVLGVLYLKDVIRRGYDNPGGQSSELVSSLMRKPAFCPDSKPVDELLKEMQLTRSHVVIVVDEFDEEIAPFVDLGDGRFRVSSRLPIDELGELFGLSLDDDDVDTVLGLMAKQLNKVPIPGSAVEWAGLELIAERATGRRHAVQTVLAGLIDTDAPSDRVLDATVQLVSDPLRTPKENDA